MGDLTAVDHVGMTLGAIGAGMSLVLLLSHEHTRTNISISLIYANLGIGLILGIPIVDEVDPANPGWQPVAVVLLGVGFCASSCSYMSGLLATSQAPPATVKPIRVLIGVCYVIAAIAGVVVAAFPEGAFNEIGFSITEPGFFSSNYTWGMGLPFVLAGSVYTITWIWIARQRLDVGERTRATCAALIALFTTVGLIAPLPVALTLLGIAFLIGIYGQYRHFVEQGQRSAFLSRFLSSEVAESVRLDGLASVMQPGERDVTVVACDLRGFTAYAEAVPSQAVIDLLSEYYEAVGVAVAEVHGTVKDYAGDGVLVLIGAPLPQADHGQAGVQLARRLHELVTPVVEHWSTGPHPLGIGVGVASGRVTVGAVGSASRMEYTAVGTAVNMAARLCSAAGDGETLISQETVALTGVAGVHARGAMPIKGLADDQQVFVLDDGSTTQDQEPREPPRLRSVPGSTSS